MSLLTEACFSRQFLGIVCNRFGKNLGVEESEIYFRKFSIYSDETFTELCDRAFDLDFFPSVDWFKREYSELSERSYQEVPALPSTEMKEIENMTAEECHINFLKLRALMNNCGRMPDRRSKGKAQANHDSEIPEDFRRWLEIQPVIITAKDCDRSSLIRIMSVSPRLRSEFIEFKQMQDDEDFQEW